jgi:hypothetical protein
LWWPVLARPRDSVSAALARLVVEGEVEALPGAGSTSPSPPSWPTAGRSNWLVARAIDLCGLRGRRPLTSAGWPRSLNDGADWTLVRVQMDPRPGRSVPLKEQIELECAGAPVGTRESNPCHQLGRGSAFELHPRKPGTDGGRNGKKQRLECPDALSPHERSRHLR